MIRVILRKFFTPVQLISDYVHFRRCQKLMMSSVLKIGQSKKNIRGMANEIN